jgi:hypothetical protein
MSFASGIIAYETPELHRVRCLRECLPAGGSGSEGFSVPIGGGNIFNLPDNDE